MKHYFFTILFIFLLQVSISHASLEDDVIEQVDGSLEIKTSIKKNTGTWLPVPIPVSNPTVGTGLQAALLYMPPQTEDDPTIPTDTSGVMGMYTDSESWFAGGFHDAYWYKDTYRFRAIAGTGEFNLKYYGVTEGSAFRENPVKYNIASDIFSAQLLRAFSDSTEWHGGIRYMYIGSAIKFGSEQSGLPTFQDNMMTSSLGFVMTYDSRDNNYYPTTGNSAEIVWMRDDKSWNSNFNFDKYTAYYNHYFKLSKKDTIALRASFASVDGDAPFYLLPTLRMRGFANGLYKNNNSLSAHAEWRRKFLPRWGFIIFYEAGSVAATIENLDRNERIKSYGGGLRWRVTEDKKLNLGIDVGFSGDRSAVYVQVGEKF